MLLPYASDRPPKSPPISVALLVLFQFVVFGLVAAGMHFDANRTLALYTNMGLVPGAFKIYSPFTYAFLHEDVFHLSVNMLFLWVFGSSVEDGVAVPAMR